jgi:hypothetical protein
MFLSSLQECGNDLSGKLADFAQARCIQASQYLDGLVKAPFLQGLLSELDSICRQSAEHLVTPLRAQNSHFIPNCPSGMDFQIPSGIQ